MSEDLSSIIAAAGADSGILTGEGDAIPGELDDSGDGDSGVDGGADDDGGEPVGRKEAIDDRDDLDKELEGYGIKRDNRMPYSRVRKTFENARKKWQEGVDKTTKELNERLSSAESIAQRHRALEQLADRDPEQYVRLLAAANPAYRRFAAALDAGVSPEKVAAKMDDDPRPAPDAKFPDGSIGYSVEGMQKLEQWIINNAVKKALGEADKKYGPAVKTVEGQKAYNQQAQRIAAEVKDVEDAWGAELVKEHEAEIISTHRAAISAGTPISIMKAATKVLSAKLRDQASKARETVMNELNERPKAAQRKQAAPARRVQDKDDDGEVSTLDLIREAGKSAGILR